MAGINRPLSQMRKLEAKEALFRTRKRILKYLVLGFLKQEGLFRTAETLISEAALTSDYQLCDNIDLDIILQDYCSYYLIRFNKQPQFCRKVDEPPPPVRRPQTRKTRPEAIVVEKEVQKEADLPSTFTITKLFKNESENFKTPVPVLELKPLAGFLSTLTPEMREIAEQLYQTIIRPSGVSWDDVKGLDAAKSILIESVVYPTKYPELFTGLLEPWRGVLLHGPPGTGKTLLARAVAGDGGCVFFNITCSTLVNKWRGESEKIVKVLFEMASYYSPAVVFIDEAEAVAGERGEAPEAARRLSAQLLAELDGLARRDGLAFLLLNTNAPWEIDPAMLRRLEKRIYIPLPDQSTRAQLFEMYLSCKNIEMVQKIDFEELAKKTEGYSGSDIKLCCKEALMASVRRTLTSMNGKCQPNRKEKVCVEDILAGIEKTKPVSKSLSKRHESWQREMGST